MSVWGASFGLSWGDVWGDVESSTTTVVSGVVRQEPRVRFRTGDWGRIVAGVEGPRDHARRNIDVVYEFGSGKNRRVFTESKPPYD